MCQVKGKGACAIKLFCEWQVTTKALQQPSANNQHLLVLPRLDRTDPARQRLGLAHTPPTAGGELVCSSGRTNRQWLAERSRFQGLLSICQRREATCIQHLQALPSNLSASFYNAERVTWVKCRVTRVKCRFLPTFAHPSANGWRQLTSSRRSFLSLRIPLPTAGGN